jgi:hypothetical protein
MGWRCVTLLKHILDFGKKSVVKIVDARPKLPHQDLNLIFAEQKTKMGKTREFK